MKLKPEERKAIARSLKSELKAKHARLIEQKRKEIENSRQIAELAALDFRAIMDLSPAIKQEFIGNSISQEKIKEVLINHEVEIWSDANIPTLLSDEEVLGQIILLESTVNDASELKSKIKLEV